jgi:hypothetical protein
LTRSRLPQIAPASIIPTKRHDSKAGPPRSLIFGMTLVVFVTGIVFDRTAIPKL